MMESRIGSKAGQAPSRAAVAHDFLSADATGTN